MESFESFVALALADEDLVASECVKFPVTRRTSKTTYEETQTHGFEVDLVGARAVRDIADTRAKTTPRDDDSRNGSSSCV